MKNKSKDLNIWMSKKIKVDLSTCRPFFHESEIWWCKLGVNIGFEQDGKGTDYFRPIIVFKKFNKYIFWAIPLTHTNKEGYFYFSFINKGLKKYCYFISNSSY